MPVVRFALRLILFQTVIALCGIGLATVLGPSLSQGVILFEAAGFVRQTEFRSTIYVIDVNRGFRYNLTQSSSINTDPVWSSDGSQLIFMSNRHAPETDRRELHIMDATGRNVRRINDIDYIGSGLVWSPDGRFLAYYDSYRDTTYVLDLQTGVYHSPIPLLMQSRYPVWSPDGTMLAIGGVSRGDPLEQQFSIYIVDTAQLANWGNRLHLHQPNYGLRRVTDLSSLFLYMSWSPDNRHIAISYPTQAPNRNIEIVDITTGEMTILNPSPNHDYQPVWSPDGTKLAFISSENGEGAFNLHLFDFATGEVRQLTGEPTSELNPVWSPDGHEIAYRSQQNGRYGIYVVNVDTGISRYITVATGYSTPIWQPDPSIAVGAVP